ncbi:glycosyltransferase family 2 protein [Enterovibrio norvegicus]|uniref:glycosyltransferase family 2 protein n=1 Tax=Enterovibrio norvegicus TaxID=188144 RepID=UPI000C863CAC|nr:glycosyltransferase family 2 protein [Enterovibrio norvegicus]PMH72476.1 hypothetical protein BCU62_02355 [Enterovibrio norvegicus]
MQQKLKISIAVPTYNRLELLKETLESVLCQTYRNIEIIISDNASTDGTKEYLESLDDQRIVINYNQDNLGMVGNWDKCLELATGEYFLLLSDDDLIREPTSLKLIASELEELQPKVLISNLAILKQGKLITEELHNTPYIDTYKSGDFFEKYLCNKLKVYPCATFLKTNEISKKYADFGANLAVDACMIASNLDKESEVVYVNKELFIYRNHESMSSSLPEIWNKDMAILEEYIVERGLLERKIAKNIFSELTKRFFLQYLMRLFRNKKHTTAMKYMLSNISKIFCKSNLKFFLSRLGRS